MRKTILSRSYRYTPSHPKTIASGRIFFHAISLTVALLTTSLLVPSTVQAQGPYCTGDNCTANDVQNPTYFIGDVNGNKITSVVCTPGQPVTNVYLWLTFTVTATNRYDINVIGDIYVDNIYHHTVNKCLGDYGSGTYTVMLENTIWTCGSEMVVQNTLFSWENNDDNNNPNSCNVCPPNPSKCHRFGNLTVFAPIVADFSISSACVSGQSFEVYTFTNQTTGGATPYSNYTWNFGAGSTPTPSTISGPTASGPFTVTYSSAGVRAIGLTVTDAAGSTSVISYNIDVKATPIPTVSVDDASICTGGTSTLTASVPGWTGLTYQWQQLVSSVWSNVGTNSNTYTTPTLTTGTYTYRVLVSSGASCTVVSANSVITVVADPTVSISANDLSICTGGTTTFTATVSGGNGTTNFQWQFNNAGTWTNVGTNSNVYTTPTLTTGSYTYRLLVTQDPGCLVQSTDQVVSVVDDPTVSIAVGSPTICVGGTSTLTATVTGGAGTTTYQWQALNGAVWSNVGTNSNVYTTPVLNTAGTYTYRVMITQDAGCAAQSSNSVVVTVDDLVVTTQPSNITECVGGTLTMTVATSGGSGTITYQWQSSSDGSTGWANSSGTGNATATFTPPSTTAGTTFYRVLINATGTGCGQAISNNATATIIADPAITTQPTNVTECIGGTNTMTVAISGGTGTISYQWQQSADGSTGWANATGTGATTNTFTPPSTTAGTTFYRVLVNATGNGCGQAVSNNATAIISADLLVTTQPTSITECVDGTLTMTVSTSGGSGTITYQWQSSSNGTTGWANASGTGSTTATFTPPSTSAGTTFYRVLINAANNGCDQAVSNNATATIIADLVVTTQPSNVTECVGGTNTMTVVVSGGTGTISYQWQSSPDGTTGWANASGTGSTTATFTPPSSTPGTTFYRVLVNATGNGCGQTISNNATAIIAADITITTQPSNLNECVGGNGTITVAISGGSGTITYQWQSSANGSTGWANASGTGATTAIYTPSSAAAGTTYYRVVINAANSGCDQAVSNNSIVIISADLVITTQPTNVTECVDGTNTMTVAVSGGSGTITYQWQQSANGSTGWANSSGTGNTTTTYTPSSAAPGTTFYRVLVNAANNGCDQAVSNNATATIIADLVVTTQPSNVNECVGGTNTMTVAVTGGSGTITYLWQQSADGSTGWANSTGSGATTTTYTPSSATPGTTFYRVLINASNSGCDQVVSTNATAVISADIVITTQPSNVNECVGGTNTMSVAITGGSGAITYQWQASADGSTGWANATGTGSATATFTPPSTVSGTTYYRVLVNAANNGCDQAVSNNGIAIISPDIVITTQPTNVNECVGGTNTMSVTITGGSGAITYQWQASADGSTGWANATGTGSTTSTFTPPSATPGTTYYRVLVNAANNGCDQAVSNNGIAVISADLVVTTQPTNVNECVGGINTMSVTVSGGSGTITYQWQDSSNGSTGWANSTGTGATTASYTPSSATPGTTYYRVLVNASNNGCDQVVSNNAIAVISADLVVTTQPTNITECVGGTDQMTVTVSGGSGTITYQWQQSADGSTGWANSTGSGNSTATYTPSSAAPGTTYYRVLVNASNNGCDQAVSNNAIASIIADLVITSQPSNVTECVGGTNTMSVTVSGGTGTITYQWQQSADGSTGWANSTGTGNTTTTYTPSSASPGTTFYRVLINATGGGCGQTISNNATAIIAADLTVTTQPTNVNECIGGTNTMTVAISGGSGTITYQWQQSADGSTGWANSTGTGATTTTYTPSSTVAGTTYYRVLVNAANSGCDQVISNTATAVISPDLVITTQPTNVDECVGGADQISVAVTGGSGTITYQWQQSANGTNGWSNSTGTGATTATYTPSSASPGTTYYRALVNASNSGCDQVVSNNSVVIIAADLSITTQPNDVNECIGGTDQMTTVVTGGSGTISNQWQQSDNGTSGWSNANGIGGTTTIYTPNSASPGTTYYRMVVVASGSGCDQIVSNTAVAIITPDISITSQPGNVNECVGGTNTMSVVITGGSGTITYQWQESADGSTGWANSTGTGATTATYTPSSATPGTTYYRVLVNASNSGCDQAVSNNGIAVISPDVVITTQPTNVNECVGGTDQMSVTVSGGSGTITYQWQASANGSSGWANATGTGATTSTFTPPSATPGTTYYRVLVNAGNNGCDQAVSNNGIAVISADLVVTTQPTNVNECVGGTNTMTVAISGGSGTITYQWQQSPDGTTAWANSTGTGNTTGTYTPSSATPGTTYYRVLVNASNNGCDQAVSNNATAVIAADLVVTTQPTDVNECVGGTDQMTVTVSGGSGTITYQWQQSSDGSTGWANSTGTGNTTATYTPSSAVAGTTYYRVLVNASNNGCDQAVSNNAIATIIADLVITSQPTNVNECVGGTDQMSVTVTGGSGTITYQWQQSADGSTGWANSTGSGATTATYTPSSATPGTTYYRVLINASNSGCGQTVSNNATAVISADIVITTQPSNVNECVGGTNTMTVNITGGSGAITYQWQASADGSTGWANATGTGATTATFTPPSTVAGTTYYRVLVNAANNGCDQAVSNNGIAVISPDVEITTQPTDVNECVGGTNTMSVTITGGSGAITYQWQQSATGTGAWSNAPGATATTATYTVPGATPGTTYYRVLVNAANNGCDQAVSNNGIAVISADLVVTTQPTNVNECVGGTNTMSVTVSGGSGTITYQWQQSSTGTGGWSNSTGTGATANTYTPDSSTPGTTYYRVLVNASNSGCDQVVSNNATAVINADLVVTTQPSDVTECVGGTDQMTVTVSGGSGTITYQWQQSGDGSTGWTNSTGTGNTTATYTPSSATPGTTYYRVLVNASNSGCDQAVSNNATATIIADLVITTQPTNVTECVGGTDQMTVTISGGSGTITYQWQQSPNGSTGWANSTGTGNTTATYTPSSATPGTTYYRVLVNASNSGCGQAISNNATAVINADIVITTQPSNVNECVGGTNTMSVTISGGSGAITYQWQQSADGIGGWSNSTGTGATTATYTPSSAVAGTTYYRVLVNAANSGCDQAVSNNGIAVISPDIVITTQPTDVNECVGGTNTMTVTISGGSGTITYQWQQSPDGTNSWANSTGTGNATATYTPSSATPGTTYYRVLVNAANNGCDQAVSNNAIATIIADLVVTTQPSDVNECVGGTNTMSVTVSGGSGTITYQWQQSATGTGGWSNSTGTGAITSTYTPDSSVPGTTYYRVLVNSSNNGCDQAVSNNATAVISADLEITTQPTNVNECVGGTNTMSVTITGGSGTITYQWQESADGSTGWANSTGTGATTATYTPSSATPGTTYYRVLVNASNSGCDQAVSNNGVAVISPDVVITTQPTNVNECVGGTDQMSVTVSGGSGTITYQWQASANGSSGWANATGTGATTSTFTPPSATPGTTYYRVLVNAGNNGCDQAVSNNGIAVISADLVVTTQPTNVNECVGGTNTMTVAISGGSGTITYQWQQSPDGTTAWANSTGTGNTTATYTPSSATPGTTYYRVLVNASNNGCDQAVSNNATAVIAADLVVTTQPTDVNECVGGTDQMTVTVSGGSGTITYQWQQSADGSTGWANSTGTGNTTATYTPSSAVAGTTYYRVLVNASNNGCDQAVSNNAIATIIADLVITSQPTNVNECVGGTDQMSVTVNGGSGTITYQWQQSADGSTGWANSIGSGATTATYTPSSATPGTTYYRVLINASNSGCGQTVSNNATAVISADIVITTQPSNVNECVGGTNTMTVNITGGSGAITYQWQASADGSTGWANATGTGATTATFTPPSTVAGTTYYRVLVNAANNGCDQAVSNNGIAVISPDVEITTQPTDVNECVGGTNTMSVAITGGSGAITYQWQQSATGTGAWSNAPGATATTATYTVPSATPGTTYYRVLVNAANNGCDQAVSNNGIAVISADLVVTTQPTNVNECVGGTNTMSVTVSGGSGTITYQWQDSSNGSTGWANSTGTGATTASYTPSSATPGTTYYRVLVNASNSGCDQVVSNNATAVINADLVVTTQPSDVTECVGGTDQMTVTVSGGSGTITYQWQESATGIGGWSNSTGTGATTASYTPSSATPGTTYYRVLVNASNNGCDQAVSNNATATIIADLVISTQPTNVTECVGGTDQMTVTISGGSGTITYQWQQSPNGSTGWANSTGTGNTTATYTPSSATPGTTYYRVLVNASNSGCGQAISNNATAVINADIVITTQPSNVNECVGGTNTMSVTISGGSGAITYQWQQSADGIGGWSNSTGTGATTATYTPSSAVAGTTYYRVLVNAANSGCDQAVSSNGIAVISPDIVITTQPTDVNECVGGTNTMTVTISGGSGTITYQWQQSPDGTNSWANSTGTGNTTATYTPSSATPGTTYYRVLVNAANNGCDQAVSNNAIATIIADLVVTTQPSNVNECVGGTNTMSVTVSGGSGTITYQWQQSATGTGGWSNSTGTGATASTYTPDSSVPGTTYYRVLVNSSNSGCDQVVSNNATAVISADIVITTQPSNVNECVGGTNTMSVTITGGSGAISYQWQESADGSTGWVNATGTGATTATYTPSSATPGTTYYRVLVNAANNGCDQAVSNNGIAVIAADLLVTTQPIDVYECIGGTDPLTIVVSGGSGAITYQWQQSATGTGGWSNSSGSGATTDTYIPSSVVAGTTYYRVLINSANNGCDQAVSNTAVVVVAEDLSITTQPQNIIECVGGNNVMTVDVIGGSGTIQYQWQQSPNGTTGWTNASGSGATTSTYTPVSTTAGTTYYRVLINSN